MNTETPNALNNRGKYDISMSDCFILLLVALVATNSISAWWLFLMVFWGRVWLILVDITDQYKLKQEIRKSGDKMMAEKAETKTN